MRSALSVPALPVTSQSTNPADNVLLAIRRVLAGEVYLSGTMTSVFLKSLTGGLKSVPRPLDRLTDRELEVLELIGRGHTTRQMLRRYSSA
jgi:DNA-binding NarL/FixJ family response regulator